MRRRQILAQAGAARPVAPQFTDAELKREYERIFGKPPHHRMKIETIRRKVRDDDAIANSA